jgi:hypothetical protein
MSLYCISEYDVNVNHAGPKARKDIAKTLSRSGWDILKIHRKLDDNLFTTKEWEKNKFRLDARKLRRVAAIPVNVFDWLHISWRVRPDDTLLFQYPLQMYPKVSLTALPFIRMMKRKGVKFIVLVHDLETLRGYKDVHVEQEFLSLADVLIVHNERMRQYVLSKKYCKNVVSIDLFDYLDVDQRNISSERHGIDIAGNLFYGKAGYIYKLAGAFANADFNLFGPNFVQESPEANWYRGNFSTDDLPMHLHGEFGLVWDGESLETCSGDFGNYLRYNNPHKFSLYVASGEPVIIWKEAALADFVKKEGIGIVVTSLSEAVATISQMSFEKKEEMRKNVLRIGNGLRSGYYTKAAINKALELL